MACISVALQTAKPTGGIRKPRPVPTQVELCKHVCIEASTLNGQPVQLSLLITLAQDVLLNGVAADEPVDVDLSRLTNAMATVLGVATETATHINISLYTHVLQLLEHNALSVLGTG